MIITAGIDAGSLTTKAVIIKFGDGKSEVVAHSLVPTGTDCNEAAEEVLTRAIKNAGIAYKDIGYIVGTGYGRRLIDCANTTLSEITCHATGAKWLHPTVRTVIDIGGQDSKVISLDDDGAVIRFVMNEKCAAGTGRFLEIMADALRVPLSELGNLSLSSKEPANINSMCTVFAESEVVSLIARGERKENIIAGLHLSIAKRIAAMAIHLGLKDDVVLTGGVAKNMGVIDALRKELQTQVHVGSWDPQLVGAVGAARIALDEMVGAYKKKVDAWSPQS